MRNLLCIVGRHRWVTSRHHMENVHGQRCVRRGCVATRWEPGKAAAQGCADCYRLKLRKVLKASKRVARQNRAARGMGSLRTGRQR